MFISGLTDLRKESIGAGSRSFYGGVTETRLSYEGVFKEGLNMFDPRYVQ